MNFNPLDLTAQPLSFGKVVANLLFTKKEKKICQIWGSFVLQVLIFHLVGSGWDGHSGNKHGWDQSHCLPSQSPTNHPQIFLAYQFFCTENNFYVCEWDFGAMEDWKGKVIKKCKTISKVGLGGMDDWKSESRTELQNNFKSWIGWDKVGWMIEKVKV